MGMDCCRLSGTLFIVIFCTFVVELEVNTKPPQPQSNNEQCPENQMYRSNMTICGSTCSTNDFRQQCPKETTTFDGRVCVPGMVMLPNGTCLHPNLCPCAFDGQLYDPCSDKVSVGCVDYVCSKRRWTVLSERNCKRRCRAFGDQHYITFDFNCYFQGRCEYTLFQVTAWNLACGNTGVTCKTIRVKTHVADIDLMGKMKNTINGVQVMRAPEITFNGGVLFQTDIFTVLLSESGFDIYCDGGTSVTIALSTEYSGQVGGLCDNVDGIPSNDVVDLTCGLQPSGTIADVPADFDPCVNNRKHKHWALKSCAIIREGELFAACRKIIGSADDFYRMCLLDSCGCRCVEGGNCKCFCTTVATFARECVLKGKCVQWRNTNLCPTMCESKKVYKACAKPCKKTCSNVALQPEPCCNQADHVEGCFCPEDYVENGNSVCVPLAQCPCSYSSPEPGTAVQMFPAGRTIDIDCRKCTCFNSRFVCNGNLCPPCLVDHCSSGDKCIQKTELSDWSYDCPDKSDEHPSNPNCGLLTTFQPLTCEARPPATTISQEITEDCLFKCPRN